MTRRASGVLVVLASLGLLLLAAGCGIPTEATARPIDRAAMPSTLIEEPTTTIVVYPGLKGELSAAGNYILHCA